MIEVFDLDDCPVRMIVGPVEVSLDRVELFSERNGILLVDEQPVVDSRRHVGSVGHEVVFLDAHDAFLPELLPSRDLGSGTCRFVVDPAANVANGPHQIVARNNAEKLAVADDGEPSQVMRAERVG